MKKHFVRLFLSILTIMLIVLALLFFSTAYISYILYSSWSEEIAKDYVYEVMDNLDENFNKKDITEIFITSIKDRISGLIIEDLETKERLLLGKSPNGHLGKRFNEKNIENTIKIESTLERKIKKVDTFVFNFTSDKLYLDFFEDVSTVYKLPNEIKLDDIAAKIIICDNDYKVFSIDILHYNMSVYGPTHLIMRIIFISFLVVGVIIVIIALVGSFIVSKQVNEEFKEINNALSKLLNNDFNINIKKQKSNELANISSSLESLGQNLKMNQSNRKEWIRSISHDLNTPLTSLNMVISGLEDKVFPFDDRAVSIMRKECDILVSRVDSIKYYAYLISPDLHINQNMFEISDLIDDLLFNKFRDLNIKLDIKPFSLVSDYLLLSRALFEIIKNAIENTNDEILIKVEDKRIDVINSGKLPQPLPNFFEPWSRGDIARLDKGCGLGLPIASQIAENLDLKITIDQFKDNVVASLVL